MTRKTYCGNLLWQSGLTLLAPHLPTVEELSLELQRERAAIEEAMALRALLPPEVGTPSAPRKTPKRGK